MVTLTFLELACNMRFAKVTQQSRNIQADGKKAASRKNITPV